MTADQDIIRHTIVPIMLMAGFFILIHGIALIISTPFEAADMQAFENPDDPANIIYLFVVIAFMTGLILLIAKFGKEFLIKLLILFAVGYTSFYVFVPLLAQFIGWWWPIILSLAIGISLVVLLFKYPEWYVIDLCGVIVGAGAIAIFGISLGVFIIIIFLIILAIYDAISVYKTKHMIDLADTVMDLKLPVLLVIPKTINYSLIKETRRLKEKLKKDEKRDAFFMGLGDIVMPGILVAAVYHAEGGGLLLALIVMIGTLIGFAALMTFVVKGKPQAGLPLLNGGAITAYLIGSYLLTGMLVGFRIPTF